MAVDEIRGGPGNNIFFGGEGEDFLAGRRGDDSLFGGENEDSLRGGKGHDLLVGGKGEDDLCGGKGPDRLFGGKGEDDLKGNHGDDRLIGGKADDTLTGGDGADTFLFGPESGNDLITDFSQAEGDKLDVAAFGFDDITDVTIAGANGNADTLVTFESGSSALLIGVDHTLITAADFNFA